MNDQSTPTKGELIESKLDRAAAGALAVSNAAGGVSFQNMLEVMEFAKLMSLAGSAIPPHLRNNPGGCLAATVRALELKMSPFTVANWQYEVENKGVKRVAYESQFYHACIEARAPIKTRLNFEIVGEGEERRCKVWATLSGETEPRVFLSDTLAKLRPSRNEYGTTKGSPLWDKKPDVQMFYNASRDFARIYFPDVLGGLYTKDELEEMGPDRAIDVSPEAPVSGLHERLAKAAQTDNPEGFGPGVVEAGLNGTHDGPTEATGGPEPKPKGKGRGKAKAAQEAPKGEETAAASEAQAVVSIPKTSEAEASATGIIASNHPLPKNEKQYGQWVADWLPSFDSEDDINQRWDAERKLRNTCGLTEETRKPIYDLVKARIAEVTA